MSKLGDDGKPIYNEKGKVMKGPNYLEPNLKKFVEWKTKINGNPFYERRIFDTKI